LFICRDYRWCLIHFGTGCKEDVLDPFSDAGIKNVHHPLDCDLKNDVWLGVEEFRTIDIGQMADHIHASNSPSNSIGIAYVTGNNLNMINCRAQFTVGSA